MFILIILLSQFMGVYICFLFLECSQGINVLKSASETVHLLEVLLVIGKHLVFAVSLQFGEWLLGRVSYHLTPKLSMKMVTGS